MSLTKAQMRNKVLRVLGTLPEGQTGQAWESEIVDDAIDQAQAFLESEGLAYWETSAIPDGVAQGYAQFVVGRAGLELLGLESADRVRSLASDGIFEIRRFCATADGPVRAVYF